MSARWNRREWIIGTSAFAAGAAACKFGGVLYKSTRGHVSGRSETIRQSIVKVMIKAEPAGFGTGFCIAKCNDAAKCVIVTASHVVGGSRIDSLAENPQSNAVIARDGSSDLIRLAWFYEGWMDVCAFHSQLRLLPLELAAKPPDIGETIYAVGFNEHDDYEVNIGTVSELTVNGTCRFNTTARAVPGMSGGPILNWRGQVVGMSVTGSHTGKLSGAVPLHELHSLRERMHFIEAADHPPPAAPR